MKATDSRITRSIEDRPFPTVDLFDLPFIDAPSEQCVADHLATITSADVPLDQLPIVVTPNVDIVVQLERSKRRGLRARLAHAAYVLPDGAPVVWTSRWAGTPLQARLAGSTVFSQWWPQIAAAGRSVVVYCSSEAVKVGLEAEHPGATVVVAPMIDTSDEQIGDVADAIVRDALAVDAEYCVVCIGHPKDSLIALAVNDRWPGPGRAPLTLCLGASAELHLGIKKRAPEWAQKYGLEWLIRFAQEPRRMFHRYFVRDLGFFPMAFREIAARRR